MTLALDPRAVAAVSCPARLLIHGKDEPAHAGTDAFARGLQWLCARANDVLGRPAPLAPGVHIHDLLGRPFFDAEPAWPPIDVPLPAGTYHVTVQLGSHRRRYTVTLEQGATVHLVLRLAGERP